MVTLCIASAKALPSILLPAYDLAVALRDAGVAMIGGFHTPLERECLDILLRGSAPITIYPARTFDPETDRLYTQQPKLWTAVKQGVAGGRVAIIEPPGMVGKRVTAANAEQRNRHLLDVADELLLLYASPGGKTDALVRKALERGMRVRVLDHPANAGWLELGARTWDLAES